MYINPDISAHKVAAARFYVQKGVCAAEFKVDPAEWRLEAVFESKVNEI
jgi:hypothetical protein